MVDRVNPDKLKAIIDAALLAAGEPLSVNQLAKLFRLGELHPQEGRDQIREALKELFEEPPIPEHEFGEQRVSIMETNFCVIS